VDVSDDRDASTVGITPSVGSSGASVSPSDASVGSSGALVSSSDESVSSSGKSVDLSQESDGAIGGTRTEPDDVAPTRRRRTRLTRTAVIVCSLLVLVAAVSLILTDVRGRAELRQTQVDLSHASRTLSSVRSELATTERQLTSARIESAAVASFLTNTNASLSSTQKSITTDESGLFYQGVNLNALNGCLSGVEQALNQLSVGEASGALASLGSVSSDCKTADIETG